MTGTLYLVPTPIGNPGDVTLRAIEVLRLAPVIAAEDTRHTRTLLRALDVDLGERSLISCHDHNEEARVAQLLAVLAGGDDVALVSDAGTPMVNDPGFRLVAAAITEGHPVRPLPGASAPITALIGSGLAVHEFHYLGFPPRKSAARRATFERVRDTTATLLLFEAPHRVLETLIDLRAVFGDRPAAAGRNLTKADEEFVRGSLGEVHDVLAARDVVRGEFTLVVGGRPGASDGDHLLAERLVGSLLTHGVDPRATRDVVREITGLPRGEVYDLVRAARPETGQKDDPR